MRAPPLFALAVIACGRQAPSPTATASSAPTSASAPAPSPTPASCGPLACRQFDTPREAFVDAIAGDPLVVGVGEAHAPKGAIVASATKHFTDDLLPALAGRASDLLLELAMPPTGCIDAAAEVRSKQAPATSRQAETNQSEYVTLGDRARTLGIVPDLLRPTCADMDAVRDAGDPIDASLEMISRLSAAQAIKLVDRDARSDADRGKIVVVYGGSLHNDLAPPPERARWSYAPRVDAHVAGKFVAVDLVVPEFIGDDDVWRALPWWPHYDRARLGGKATRFETGPRSFVIVLPETQR